MDNVEELLNYMIDHVGTSFHVDDPIKSYGVFTSKECEILEIALDLAHDLCDKNGVDIYELTLELINYWN